MVNIQFYFIFSENQYSNLVGAGFENPNKSNEGKDDEMEENQETTDINDAELGNVPCTSSQGKHRKKQ